MANQVAECKDRIKKALLLRDMKPIDLANATGIDKSSISHYINGRVKPKQDRIFLMAKALSVDPAWLMGLDTTMEPKKDSDTASADPDAAFLQQNPEYRILFDAAKKVKREDLDLVKQMLDRFADEAKSK